LKLTFEEQARLLDGLDVWRTKPLGDLPSLMMADGPHGLRKQYEFTDNLGAKGSVPATCFPTASLLACSFDRQRLNELGKRLAIEAKANQVHVVLGPGINMKRTPLCGRNFEYFSEDPFLAGELAASYVRGVEDMGVGTSVKHFFANNQEKNRFFVNSIVDERALREIYLKAFERVVAEQPASVMASYNKINGFYATEHPYLKQVLRNEWGFQGVVVSDWGAVHHKVRSVKAGTDLEMPSSFGYRTEEMLSRIAQDPEFKKDIEASAKRIEHMVKKYVQPHDATTYLPEDHHQFAKVIASESMVLLKNNNILPLNRKQKVLIVGGFIDHMRYQGAGSSLINPTRVDQISEIINQYTNQYELAHGYTLEGTDERFILSDQAIEKAKQSDVVVYLFGLPDTYEAEGFDREDLTIPQQQVDLLQKIYEVNPNIVGVAIGGAVMDLSVEQYMKGLLLAYLGGQASASAILDLVFGIQNPSGRLAETFIDEIESCNVQLTEDNNAVYYDESIFIGYRYYHTFEKSIRYPFGYGLSYTTFEYSSIKVDKTPEGCYVSMTIKNTGKIKGKEVIQVYVDNPKTSVFRAKRELKAFDKIELEPGETKSVGLMIHYDQFKYYDIHEKRWILEQEEYRISVCKHANDLIASIPMKLKGETVKHIETSYHQPFYDTSSFRDIVSTELPPLNIQKGRPYTLSSTLSDAQNTWMGRVISNAIIKEGLKTVKKLNNPWMNDMMKKTMLETPIQMLVLFSSGSITFLQAEGMIDIMNLKLGKGLKKLLHKNKEKKNV
jgi:beta-glucosidase